MRKQIITGMLVLLLLILPVALYLLINQSFSQSVTDAEKVALEEEAKIYRELKSEMRSNRDNQDEALRQALRRIIPNHTSETQHLQCYINDIPLTGVTVSAKARSAGPENQEERTTVLSPEDHSLYVIRSLSDHAFLFVINDIEGYFQLRHDQTTIGLFLLGGGIILALFLSLLISGRITSRLDRLSQSADIIRSGQKLRLDPSDKNDEIGKLTNTFIAMNDAVEQREESLKEQARQRQQLIDALAHEMRTPLTSIVSAARLIQNESVTSQMRNEMCDLIVKESKRLSDMDANLMKLTQMNGAELKLETFSLREMAQEALIPTPDVELDGEDHQITGDRSLIIHLLRNLVNNARKSGTKTPVRVSLFPNGFSVSDEGCGMNPEEVKQCTQPFWKADPARTRASGGAGLGLSLCAEIARRHNTELIIRSTPGQGTVVQFILPPLSGKASEAAPAGSPAES